MGTSRQAAGIRQILSGCLPCSGQCHLMCLGGSQRNFCPTSPTAEALVVYIHIFKTLRDLVKTEKHKFLVTIFKIVLTTIVMFELNFLFLASLKVCVLL